MSGHVDCVLLEHIELDDVQRSLMSGCEHNVRGNAIAVSPQPVRRRDAPAVARGEPGELVLRDRGAQIVADAALVLEELSRDDGADRVAALVLRPGPAAAVPVEPGHWVRATRLQLTAQDIAITHLSSIDVWGAPYKDRAAGRSRRAWRGRPEAYIGLVMFDVTADSYARFMGRFSEPLAPQFAELAGVQAGQRALDVGCGPGALTAQLVQRLGTSAVSAIDPSASFVAAIRARFPGIDVRSGAAEQLPFPGDCFDVTLAQLVVHFMTDPVTGLAEMARVTRPGGVVAACVWDHAGGAGPLATFWRAVHDVDPVAHDEAGLPGARAGHLAHLCDAAGLRDIESTSLTVTVTFETFADWWEPFTLGVGPAGAYVAKLAEDRREMLRTRCAQLLPAAPFPLNASAWCVRAHA